MNNAPIFIVGVPRSGTTLLRLMLNNHPRIHIPPESQFIDVLYFKYNSFDSNLEGDIHDKIVEDLCYWVQNRKWGLKLDDVRQRLKSESPSSIARMLRSVFELSAEQAGKPRWGDKTPKYLFKIELIKRLFPDAQVIHIIRDGRDVACSAMGLNWGPNNIYDAALQWRDGIRKGQMFSKQVQPRYYFQVLYEDLVRQPEHQLNKIMNFLKEDYRSNMMDYAKNMNNNFPQVSKGWHYLVNSNPTTIRIGRWKKELNKEEIDSFECIASNELSQCGYVTGKRRPSLCVYGKCTFYTIKHVVKNLLRKNYIIYQILKRFQGE